mmetsp:Transcript_27112/g.66497  ORF Transcript_27112/g.66497 Transcript_27112/m.66497 type:complete len:110 (+) Transcript_27112:1802-2131(+)
MINEMLGLTDENEPLQAMMKDQFANYVVQKLLEVCDEEQRKQLLSRMKLHLPNLKKYTYGKHIVVRVEKLITTNSPPRPGMHAGGPLGGADEGGEYDAAEEEEEEEEED